MNNFFQRTAYKILHVFFALGFVCVFIVGAVMAYPKYRKSGGLAEERERIRNRIAEKRREISDIKAKQQRFKTDREFVEMLARRDKRIFPGELVFIFDD